jgi:phosphoribosylformylglycinamidine cyclo-ligase
MKKILGLTYKDAGVDTKKAAKAVDALKPLAESTFNSNVLGGIGSFGSMFQLPIDGMKEPVLVSGTDGVGTKLKIAFMMNRHNTIGIDCVAMCVNDILCQGAKPLFFLDYIATGKLEPQKIKEIVEGLAEGCLQSKAALIGGETAEMPGFYQNDEYDIAGFCVGVVDKKNIIDGSSICAGNVLVGLASSGLHSNGFSLVRSVLLQDEKSLNEYVEELGITLGEELLKPTKIYFETVQKALKIAQVRGMVHITGGGFYENIPRVIPKGLGVLINANSWETPPIFPYIKKVGGLEDQEMFSTFNMGIGFIFVAPYSQSESLINGLNEMGEKAFRIGEVIAGEGVSFE